MEMHERIRKLRKEHLHLSQEAFGEKLGVSRSVVNNIERNVLARPEQKLSLIKLMCREFNVNEDWLLNGNQPMFVQPKSFSLDEFVKNNDASDLELAILKAYFELDPDIRKAVIQHFKDKLENKETAPLPDIPDTPEEFEAAYPPLEEDGADVG